MGKQVLALDAPPSGVAASYARRRGAFVLDGGNDASWGVGRAWYGDTPAARLLVRQTPVDTDPLTQLEAFAAREFGLGRAAVVVALSYDLGRTIERIRSSRVGATGQLLLYAASYDSVLEHDYASRTWSMHGAGLPTLNVEPVVPPSEVGRRPQGSATSAVSNWTKAEYLAAVERALAYLAAGDIYQVNLAQQFSCPWDGSPADLFAWWRRQNPAPFAACIDCDDLALVSNSPECLLALEGRRIATYPIKGTRRRSADPEVDQQLVEELATNPKERAEHVMIVDLERNDLGRVCAIGSVRVRDFATVRSFPAVHHMVSVIEGELKPEIGLAALLRATFPGGSITGAPKIRAMEIIDEIEPSTRGFYTGAAGILWPSGDLRLALTIRTATIQGQTITYPSGGGIVADSTAEGEYQETLLKARPFLDAVEALA